MNEENLTAQLKDIKPLLEIPDSTYMIYWGLIISSSVLFLLISAYFLNKFLKNRKKDKSKSYLKKLQDIDWKDPKKAAYEATYYARLLARDEEQLALFSKLELVLEQYKYKKEVQSLDKESKALFEEYLKVVHAGL